MLSRVADTIYWLGRYMERNNGMLQVIGTTYISSQDEPGELKWQPLVKIYGDPHEKEMETESDSRKILDHLIFSHTNLASAYNNVMQSRENARSVQDHISKEVWQCLNDYYHLMRNDEIKNKALSEDPISLIDMLIKNGLLFTGTVDSTMTRGEGFTYLNIGKFLERAIHTTEITKLEVSELLTSNSESESADLRYLLYSLLGFEVYLKTYKGNFTLKNVIEMIIQNTDFPHSILYSLERLYKYFERLRPESLPQNFDEMQFLIGKTMNNIKYSSVHEADLLAMQAFLSQTRYDLFEIAGAFSKYYFGNT